MAKLEVFDPPMCCSTGVCGPEVDGTLVRFAADLEWLKGRGVTVERHGLAQEPGVFAAHRVVHAELANHGIDCLPLTLFDGRSGAAGEYPRRESLDVLLIGDHPKVAADKR